jgi:O-antigen/teichoic acid export membrane protein
MRPFVRVIRGFLWTSAGNITAQGIGLLAGIIAARWLGKSQFGELNLIRSTVLMLAVFAGSGLGITVSKYVSEFRDREPQRCGQVIAFVNRVAIGLGVLVVGVSMAYGTELVQYALGTRELAVAFQIGAFLVLLHLFSAIQYGVLIGLESFRALSTLLIVEACITFLGTAIGARDGILVECLLGILVAAVVNATLRGWAARSLVRHHGIAIPWRGKFTDTGLLWRFALPSVLIGAMIWPFEWLSRLFVARTGNGMDELGIFSAAHSWGVLVLFLANQITTPAVPALSNLYGAGDRNAFLRTARIVLAMASISAIAVALVLAAGSELIIEFYGESFANARGVLFVLLLGYAVASFSVLGSIFSACGRMWWQVLHYAVWGLTLAAGAFLWRSSGANGLAWSYVCAYIALVTCQATFAYRLLRRTNHTVAKQHGS